jgi:GntR family transcriptional regulator/MocR family aminotransferase
VGYVVLPPPLLAPFTAAKFLADRHSPTLEQRVLADFIQEGHFERHLRRSRTWAATRRKALLRALSDYLGARVNVAGADAGLHTLLWLRGLRNSQIPRLVRRAAAAGVGVYSVAPYYLRPPRQGGLLLGYAAMNERDTREGIRLLASVL